jgi:poly(3-hydroxybutyrate) depolymerase
MIVSKQNVSLGANTNGYLEYLPSGYSTSKKYPLFLSLHGKGDLGNGSTQLSSLLTSGLPMIINTQGFEPDAIVLFPQFKFWPTEEQIEGVITRALLLYNIDASRIYLTGLSMGGGEALNTAALFTSKIAAVFAICPASQWRASYADNIAKNNLPVLSVHAKNDSVCPVTNTMEWVSNINLRPTTVKAKQVLLETGDHNIWNTVYDPFFKVDNNLNWYQWMLQYSNKNISTTTTSSSSTTTTRTTSVSTSTTSVYKIRPEKLDGWSSDASFRKGGEYNSTSYIYGDKKVIKNTDQQDLYNQEIWGKTIDYEFPLLNGDYLVKLNFVELYHDSVNQRVFNVDVQNEKVLQNFDILSAVGKFTLLTKEVHTKVFNGKLVISFNGVINNATISSIEIIKLNSFSKDLVIEYKDITGNIVKTIAEKFDSPVIANVYYK